VSGILGGDAHSQKQRAAAELTGICCAEADTRRALRGLKPYAIQACKLDVAFRAYLAYTERGSQPTLLNWAICMIGFSFFELHAITC